MDAIFDLLADPAIRTWYLVFFFALLVLPITGLSIWYHAKVRGSAEGARLMDQQARMAPGSFRHLGAVTRSIPQALQLARDISAGRYGERLKNVQRRVYWFVALWFAMNLVVLGLLIMGG